MSKYSIIITYMLRKKRHSYVLQKYTIWRCKIGLHRAGRGNNWQKLTIKEGLRVKINQRIIPMSLTKRKFFTRPYLLITWKKKKTTHSISTQIKLPEKLIMLWKWGRKRRNDIIINMSQENGQHPPPVWRNCRRQNQLPSFLEETRKLQGA